MALLYPAVPSGQPDTGGYYREVDTLERLARSLPDAYALFHNVDWAVSGEHTDLHGEIDIVVMNQSGDLLLVEVKSGQVDFRSTGIYKQYSNGERQVDRQVNFQYSSLRNRLQQARLSADVKSCLVLPDHRIGEQEIVGMPRDRIVDSTEFDQLGAFIRSLLPVGMPNENAERIKAFLLNDLEVVKDFSVLNEQIRVSNKRISGGLATWIPRITAPSGTLVVSATAGSGKTLLALQLLEQAVNSGNKALYVCFNRSLADTMTKIAPVRSHVATFHELSIRHYEREVGEVDFNQEGIFNVAAKRYIEYLTGAEADLDVLVIDEAQDFEMEWVEALSSTLKDSGMLYVLQDHEQRLYDREVFDCADAVLVESRENFRCPRAIVQTINMLGIANPPIQARSTYTGNMPVMHIYENTEKSLLGKTAAAVTDLLEKGFKPYEIVILSMRGLKNSLLAKSRIGQHHIRYFTGQFDQNRDPVWTDGDIVFDSVYRFKGQSAPAVIISEIDFEAVGDIERRKLFVAMTRAEIELVMIMTADAEAALMGALQ